MMTPAERAEVLRGMQRLIAESEKASALLASEERLCKTCGWWGAIPSLLRLDGKACACPSLCEWPASNQDATDQLVYCYDEGRGFHTQPNFGCVHWKQRDE
jgi:hypothetical protein